MNKAKQKQDLSKDSVMKLLKLTSPDRFKWVMIILLLIISAVLITLGPLALANVTDSIVNGLRSGGIDWKTFFYWVEISLTLYVSTFVTRWGADMIAASVTSRISYRLRAQLEDKLWELPLNFYDTTRRGDIMSRVSNDIDTVVLALNSATSFIYNLILLVGIVVVMLILSWQLAIVSIIILPLSAVMIKRLSSASRPKYIDQSRNLGTLNSNIEESFNGHNLIKAYGQEEAYIEKFREQNRELFFSSLHANVLSSFISPSTSLVTNLIYIVVAIYGAIRVILGVMTIGEIQAFIQYSRQLNQPFSMISQNIGTFQMGLASLSRIEALLKEENEVAEWENALDTHKLSGRIDFKDVSFSYLPERPLIEDLNLNVKPGQTIAIVGETGAGKTTLVNLIERFYEIKSGQILLDGKYDLHELSRKALRENIGMVLQDTWLFEGTIEENIRYSLPDNRKVDEEEFLEACRASFVDQFVKSLPDGYNTIVGNEQSAISAGEKQLITIARTFILQPNILILDEATSCVDTRIEALIQEAINRLREGRTSFIIAHRLSTIKGADIILVMKDGHIVEQGSHEELIKLGGAYSDLYNTQFDE